MKLWKKFDGEPYLINPHLVMLNPRKRSNSKRRLSAMAKMRNRLGQFVKRTRKAASNPKRHKKSYARAASNPVRKQKRTYKRNAYFGNPRPRRHYKRNPGMFAGGSILGMSLKEIGFAGAGFIAPPAIEGLIKGMLPTALTSNAFGRYAVKGGIVAGVSLLGGKFLGREAGKYLAIGGVTYLVANIVVDFVPQLFSGFSGYMNPGQSFAPRALRGQPGLGRYVGMGTAVSTANVPERLNPASRY